MNTATTNPTLRAALQPRCTEHAFTDLEDRCPRCGGTRFSVNGRCRKCKTKLFYGPCR
jgi:hypothetical protein